MRRTLVVQWACNAIGDRRFATHSDDSIDSSPTRWRSSHALILLGARPISNRRLADFSPSSRDWLREWWWRELWRHQVKHLHRA